MRRGGVYTCMRMMATVLALSLATVAISGQAARPGPPAQVPADTWVVEVSTSGGLTGAGKGNVSVQWDGALVCTPPLSGCAAVASRESTARLSTLITNLISAAAPALTSTPCSDCFVTTMTVKRRTADGGEIVRRYSWNDADFPGMPEPLKRLHAEVLALSQRR
jgi:hypothetical protein